MKTLQTINRMAAGQTITIEATEQNMVDVWSATVRLIKLRKSYLIDGFLGKIIVTRRS